MEGGKENKRILQEIGRPKKKKLKKLERAVWLVGKKSITRLDYSVVSGGLLVCWSNEGPLIDFGH